MLTMDKDQQSLQRVGRALLVVFNRLMDRHPDMTIFQARFLMAVACSPGITQRELYRNLNASDSVASRTLAILAEYGARNTAGLELITIRINPQDRRERLLDLTQKGKRLMLDVASDLGMGSK